MQPSRNVCGNFNFCSWSCAYLSCTGPTARERGARLPTRHRKRWGRGDTARRARGCWSRSTDIHSSGMLECHGRQVWAKWTNILCTPVNCPHQCLRIRMHGLHENKGPAKKRVDACMGIILGNRRARIEQPTPISRTNLLVPRMIFRAIRTGLSSVHVLISTSAAHQTYEGTVVCEVYFQHQMPSQVLWNNFKGPKTKSPCKFQAFVHVHWTPKAVYEVRMFKFARGRVPSTKQVQIFSFFDNVFCIDRPACSHILAFFQALQVFKYWVYLWSTLKHPANTVRKVTATQFFDTLILVLLAVSEWKLSSSMSLKVFSPSCNASVKLLRIPVHGIMPFCCRDLPDFLVDAVLEQLGVVEPCATNPVLQQGKQPVIWRAQIRRITWMRQSWNLHLSQELSDRAWTVSWCIVMQESPASGTENLWPTMSHSLDESLDDPQKKLTSDSDSSRNKFTVDKSKLVKKTNQHDLWSVLFNPWHNWSLLTLGQPRPVLEAILGVPGVKPGFITTDDMVDSSSSWHLCERCFGASHLTQFLSWSQQMRNPLWALFLHIQVFAQKSVCCLQAQIDVCRQLSDTPFWVLIEQLLHLSNFLRCPPNWSSRAWCIFNPCPSILELWVLSPDWGNTQSLSLVQLLYLLDAFCPGHAGSHTKFNVSALVFLCLCHVRSLTENPSDWLEVLRTQNILIFCGHCIEINLKLRLHAVRDMS